MAGPRVDVVGAAAAGNPVVARRPIAPLGAPLATGDDVLGHDLGRGHAGGEREQQRSDQHDLHGLAHLFSFPSGMGEPCTPRCTPGPHHTRGRGIVHAAPRRLKMLWWMFSYKPVGARSRRAAPLSTAACRTASETCKCTVGSRAYGTSSPSEVREARTSAAAIFISGLICFAPESRAPRKMPG